MKSSIILFAVTLISLNTAAHVNLNNPTGGEAYNPGDTVILEWEIAINHTLLNWDLFISYDNGANYDTIQIDIPPTGQSVGTIDLYTWVVPNNPTTQAKIWIKMDNSGTDYQDISPNFTIQDNVYIPDVNFKAQLVGDVSVNTSGDSEIQVTEASAYTGTIIVPGLGIADLTGIEAFPNITTLDCSVNSLTAIDLSQNTAITVLNCGNNQITALDVSNNTALTDLICDSNLITVLDVSNNLALLELVFELNQVSLLDVSNNTALTHLHCDNNQLASIDVTNNPALIMLSCPKNVITSIDISINTSVLMVDCALNYLTYLNVKNGNNVNFMDFNALNNPGLTCIIVDSVAFSTSNWTQIDGSASFSTDCIVGIETETAGSTSVKVFPNPNSGLFNLLFESAESGTLILSISNYLGQEVYTQSFSGFNGTFRTALNLSAQPSGVYNIQLITDKQVIVRRVVLQ